MRHTEAGIVRGETGRKRTGELVMGLGERCCGDDMQHIKILLLYEAWLLYDSRLFLWGAVFQT